MQQVLVLSVNMALEGRMLCSIRIHRMQRLNGNEISRVCLQRQSDYSVKMIIQKEQCLTREKKKKDRMRVIGRQCALFKY